jgi:hypothetical protein
MKEVPLFRYNTQLRPCYVAHQFAGVLVNMSNLIAFPGHDDDGEV